MKGRLLWFVLGAVVGVALAGGIAYAATARSAAVTIHACYGKKGGVLRLATACRKNELPVSWNQTGPAGPMGPTGPQGPVGVPGGGPAGATGPSGVAVELAGSLGIGPNKVAIGSGGGLTFTASCSAGPTLHIFAATSSGTATTSGVVIGQLLDQVTATTSGNDEILTQGGAGFNTSGSLFADTLTPVQVTILKSDGTSYQGVVTVAVSLGATNCFVSGALVH